MLPSKEAKQSRKRTKADISWDVPWGTHICLFYKTKEDLVDILVPYFRTGLENNEFCMWITSASLNEKEAKDALRGAMPDFDQYLQGRNIQIVSHSQWYLRNNVFSLQRVLNAWVDKLNKALAADFEGLRVAGDGSSFERKEWAALTKYEEQVHRAIGKYRMVAICSYCIDKCGASEIIDVVTNHGSALIRQQGKWNVIESTQHEITKEALRNSERKYHALSENLKEVVYRADIDTLQATYINSAIEEVYGYSRDEWLRDPNLWENTIYPEDKEKIIAKFTKAREKHEDGVLEYRIVRKDNAIRWVEDRYSWEKGDQGNVLSLHGVLYDITERKLSEQQIEDLAKFPSENPNPVLRISHDRTLLYANPASRMLLAELGCEAGRAIPESWHKFITDVLDSGSSRNEEITLVHNIFSLTFTPIANANYVNVYGFNITEQKRMQEMLRASEKMAAKGQLAAQIAHEINNPLGGIKNSFLLIKDAVAEDHPYYRYVGLISKEIKRISDIIRQMFDLYLPNGATVKKFLIKDVLCEITKLLEVNCHERNVVISINSYENDAVVVLPEAPLRQALFNIVKNAVEASPPSAKVKVTATVAEDALRLTVCDQGHGVPEQAQSKILEPFFTTKGSQQAIGLGLGLSISKEIVEGMGGNISFKSKSGQGTVFSIVIPLDRGRKGRQNGSVGANFDS